MKKKLFFFVFLIVVQSSVFSQIHYIQNKIPCDSIIYNISVHWVKCDPALNHNLANITSYIASLNNIFSKTCIQFRLCNYDTISDYNYFFVQDEKRNELPDLVKQKYTPHQINLYWVGDYEYSQFYGICDLDPINSAIFFSSGDINPFNALNFDKLFLNYFGLSNTNFILPDKELVNNSNGTMVADSVWDTPSDPFYLVQTRIPFKTYLHPLQYSSYFYSDLKDPNGHYYNPMKDNIMSNLNTTSPCFNLTRYQSYKVALNERKCRGIIWKR